MHSSSKAFTTILFVLLLTSCATTYGPEGSFSGGYSEIKLNDRTYQITFNGNAYTSQSKVKRFALRRAAELTIQNGGTHFIILTNNTAVETSTHTQPTTVTTHGTSTYMGHGIGTGSYLGVSGVGMTDSYTTINPGSTYQMHEYSSNLTIKILDNNKRYRDAYEAQTILGNFLAK